MILSFGEILWDRFPSCRVAGGSPFNVAAHLRHLGLEAELVSAIGDDQPGDDLMDVVRGAGLRGTLIYRSPLPTGEVLVTLDDTGEPEYTVIEDTAWDFIPTGPDLITSAGQADAFVFASLSQRSMANRRTLDIILDCLPDRALVVFDCNLRPPFVEEDVIRQSVSRSDVVKCNESEWRMIRKLYGLGGGLVDAEEAEGAAQDLPSAQEMVPWLEEVDLKALLITRGGSGSTLYTREGARIDAAAGRIPDGGSGGDFVGVGDAFLAACIAGMLRGTAWGTLLGRASEYAAWVASEQGGTPRPSAELVRATIG